MSLIVNKVTSSSIQINYSYLDSSNIFGYEVTATYKVDFADISFTNESNVLFSGINALREAYLRKNLVARIGTDEFVNGRITTQTFEQSFLVGDSSCSITIIESKRLDDYSSNEFATHIPSPQWIESFQENFSFSRSGDSYSFSRNTSLKYKQDTGSQFLNKARIFLKNTYFNNRPNYGYQIDGISENGRFNGGFRPLVSESIDVLNLTVSIQENLESSLIEGDFSRRQTYSLELDEGGYLLKRYTVEIKALKEPLEQVAEQACITVLEDIMSDNTSFFEPIEIGKGINKDGGLITLNISFSSNPSLNSETPIFYSVVRSKRQTFYDYSLNIDISSIGKTKVEKLKKAKEFWGSIVPTYKSKVASLFTEASPIYEKNRSTSFSQKEGKISETVVYTDEESYQDLPEPILKLKITYSTNPQLDRMRTFVDTVNKLEKVEFTENLKTIGNGSITAEAVAKKSAGLMAAKEYLENEISNPSGNITSDTFSISESLSSRVINYEFV